MKFKVWLVCLLSVFTAANAYADNDAGIRYITTRGKIFCGTEAGNKILASKDEKGVWQGIDVELCKMLSTAIFGKSDRYEIIPLSANQVSKALATNKIDVMIGGIPYSATNEMKTAAYPAALYYYDKQGFLAKSIADAQSMEAYKGSKVCVVNQTDDLSKLKTYNEMHQLEFSILPFPNLSKAREAFLLKRCQLLTANIMLLKDILDNSPAGTSDIELLPETIVLRPVYIYVERNNATLRSIVKWTLNTIRLAEELSINAENIELTALTQDQVVKNMLGLDPKLWSSFKLEPTWAQTFIKESGNFAEIYEKTLGKDSKYKIPRAENNLLKNGGMFIPDTFL